MEDPKRLRSHAIAVLFWIGLLVAAPAGPGARADAFSVAYLVSDDAGFIAAPVVDPSLLDPRGLASSPTGALCVANHGSNVATFYTVSAVDQAAKAALTVALTGGGGASAVAYSPVGSAFAGDVFLFSDDDGTISGWRPILGSAAERLVLGDPLNAYVGATLGVIGSDAYLYVADFSGASVDVYRGSASSPYLSGSFVDPVLPSGYAPFNVQNLGGTLYVTYAKVGLLGEPETGSGKGIVDAFDLQGNLLARVATGGDLDAPWGLAIAPASFGALAGRLLVGNFGDGRIHAYDVASQAAVATLVAADSSPLVIDGLHGLAAGNGGTGGDPDAVYFTAGPGAGAHGVLGAIRSVPEPDAGLLLAAGIVWLGGGGWRRLGGRQRSLDAPSRSRVAPPRLQPGRRRRRRPVER